jgi:hypothetical protein
VLRQGLSLNDELQRVLAKHDALASGAPMPFEPARRLKQEEDHRYDKVSWCAPAQLKHIADSIIHCKVNFSCLLVLTGNTSRVLCTIVVTFRKSFGNHLAKFSPHNSLNLIHDTSCIPGWHCPRFFC